jgi:integrase
MDAFPRFGKRPIAEIAAPELLAALRKTEARGAVGTAQRVLQTCGQVFRYAVATGRANRDPTADLRGALNPVKGSHFAAITDPKDIGPLLRAMYDYQGSAVTRANSISNLIFVCVCAQLRPANLAPRYFNLIPRRNSERLQFLVNY